MASDLLHIKDSFYFDVPRKFWRANFENPESIADSLGNWAVQNDPHYQDWEADFAIGKLEEIVADKNALEHAKEAWYHWQHAKDERHGRPFDQYVVDATAELESSAAKWVKSNKVETQNNVDAYLAEHPDAQAEWMVQLFRDAGSARKFQALVHELNSRDVLDEYLATRSAKDYWNDNILSQYNHAYSGKVFIPQPFGELRNAYEKQSGFAISRYMIIEVIVAVMLLFVFRWLAGKVKDGSAPKGKLWNLLESFVVFIRTDVVEKGMDPHDSPKYMPLMWTIFLFILGCNLMGMLPWVGSPTAAFAVTGVLALIVFLVGLVMGIRSLGVLGFFKNLCPDLGLPIYLGIVIVPMVWLIEFASLFIKHGILAVRLLANMVAGHLVLLGIMGLAFGAKAAAMGTTSWTALSIVALAGTTVLSFMELFVAFLQAYVFTLLASLFIGSATHHH
ncbi:MAG: F0F1 ATP synthase subunit A [Planctomycetales bacterium]|nr:F0F1 ATP synthase subunit A [Planctomycetales bacterium]